MTVTWHPYTGETSAICKSGASVHFNYVPTKPYAPPPEKALHLISMLTPGSLLRERLEYKYGIIHSAPLHASQGTNLPLRMSQMGTDKWRRSHGLPVPN